MFELHLLTFELFFISFSTLYSDFLEGVIVSSIVIQSLVIKVNDLVARYIQELSSMGNDNYCILTIDDIILKPHHSI